MNFINILKREKTLEYENIFSLVIHNFLKIIILQLYNYIFLKKNKINNKNPKILTNHKYNRFKFNNDYACQSYISLYILNQNNRKDLVIKCQNVKIFL